MAELSPAQLSEIAYPLVLIIGLGAGSSLVVEFLRSFFELDRYPRFKRTAKYYPVFLCALLTTFLPQATFDVDISMRWALGIVYSLAWYPIYTKLKANLARVNIKIPTLMPTGLPAEKSDQNASD